MGFGGMEDMEAMIYGDDDDDDLEAELAALAGDDAQPKKSSPKRKGLFSKREWYICFLNVLKLKVVLFLLLFVCLHHYLYCGCLLVVMF